MERSAQSAAMVRLEDYEEGLLAGLARLGYASRSRDAQRYLLRHLLLGQESPASTRGLLSGRPRAQAAGTRPHCPAPHPPWSVHAQG